MELKYIIPIIFLLLVTNVSAVTVSGGVTEDIRIGDGIVGIMGFTSRLDKSDIPNFMDTMVMFQGQYYDIHDELILSYTSPSIETSLTSNDDNYNENVVMEAKKKSIYYMLMIDDSGLDISKATKYQPFEVDFLGKKLKIIDVPDGYNDRFEAIVGDRYYLYSGDIVNVNDKQITLVNVGSGGQVEIDVDGYQDMIPAASTKLINGIEIYLDSTFYASEPYERAAVMYIGNPAVKVYRNGDAYIGEDEAKPDWKWAIGNLASGTLTEINYEGGWIDGIYYDEYINISGSHIGIYNNFQADDSSDEDLVGVGECYNLPNGYAEICLDSLTVADSDYLPVTVEYVDNVDLSDVGLSTNEKAIHIHAPGDSFTITRNDIYNMEVGNIIPINSKQITLVNVGSDGAIQVDVNGVIDTIPKYDTKVVNEVEITVSLSFYASTKSERAAQLVIKDTTLTIPESINTSEIWIVPTNMGYFKIFKTYTKYNENIVDFGGTYSFSNTIINYQNTDEEFTMWLDPVENGVYLELYADKDPTMIIYTEVLKVFFGIENGEINSLGNTSSLAEVGELLWDDMSGQPENMVDPWTYLEIGKKDENHRSIYGMIIENPFLNGAFDKVVLQIPGDRVQANVVIKGEEEIIIPEEPLIVEILNPKNSSTISTNSVWLDVMTNKNAACSYTLKKCTIPEPQPEPEPVDCSLYDGMTCQEIIDYTNDVLEKPYAYCECGEVLDMCTTDISALACPAPEPPECGICIMNPVPIDILTIDGLYHSILIEDINNPWSDDTKVSAELTVSCQDTSSNVVEDLITFIIDLTRQGIMEEYINLNTGWNLFSIPVTQNDTTTETVINGFQGEVEVIYGYEQGQWKVWRNNYPTNTLTNLEAGKGYFIKLTEPVTLHVEGTIGVGEPPVIPTFNVYQGWNLIGYYGTEDTITFMALRNIWGKYSAIWTLFGNDVQALQGSLKGLGLEEFDEELKRTHGYWLYMQEDGIIVPTN